MRYMMHLVMSLRTVLITVVALLVPSIGLAQWTNEPTGFTTVFDSALSNLSGLIDVYNSTTIQADSSAPLSPPGNMMHRLEAFAQTGGGTTYLTTPTSREMFVGLYARTNSGWQGRTVQDKFMFTRGPQNNAYWGFKGGPTKGGPMYFFWAHNSGNLDNSHICGGPPGLGSGGNCDPNVGSGQVGPPGTWFKIEVYLKCSTTLTSRDGIVGWWVNGAPAGWYTQVNNCANGLNEWIWDHTWDGTGDMGVSNTVPWEWRIDHLHVSVRSGGGGPPPTDTTPPTQVTGVAVTSVAASTIGLSWNPSNDNVGITGYHVEMCTGQACTTYVAKQSTTGTGTTVVITGLSPATPYSFRLKARDAAGNVSAQYSTPVTATTSSPGSGTVTRNTLATDNFNRADNTDLGSGWDGDYYATGATAPLQIVSNKVRAGVASTKESNETYNAVALPSDQWAQVTLTTWAADGTQRYAWVNLRAGAPQTPSYYQCQAARNDSNGYTSIIERENGLGVFSFLAQDTSVTWAAGDTLSCEAIGTNPTIINLYRNGTLVTSASDNSSLTNLRTGAGIWTAGLTAVEIDDFLTGDFTGVTLPRITGAETDATGANITWSGGPVSIRVNYDGGQIVVPVSSLTGGRFNFIWPADTTFACFFGIDAQGNVNTITEDYVCDTVVPSTVDATPPTVSSPFPTGTLAAGTTSTTISVVTSEPAVCKFATSAGVAYSEMIGVFMTPVSSTQHSASVTGLSNNTTYTYYVKCADFAGNITLADTVLSFSVNASPTDIIAPTQPTAVVGMALNANQVQLSFTPATDAVGVAGYQVFACITASCITYDLVANGGGSPIIVNGLQSNTSYNFKLRAFDAVQNLGDFSSVVVVITPILDTISPSRLLNLVATRTGYDTFLLTWDPGTDDNQIAGAAIEICVGDGCNVFKLQYIATGRTSITINGLASQLPYYFRGKHIDSAGNVSEEYSELAKGEPFPLQSGTVQGVCACQIP